MGGGGVVQLLLVCLPTILSLVALVKASAPLEDNPPALGVQCFTVRHCSVMVMVPM